MYTRETKNPVGYKNSYNDDFAGSNVVVKCDWCLDYGDDLIVTKNYFKRDMLKNGKSIEINLCTECKKILIDILENNP